MYVNNIVNKAKIIFLLLKIKRKWSINDHYYIPSMVLKEKHHKIDVNLLNKQQQHQQKSAEIVCILL